MEIALSRTFMGAAELASANSRYFSRILIIPSHTSRTKHTDLAVMDKSHDKNQMSDVPVCTQTLLTGNRGRRLGRYTAC